MQKTSTGTCRIADMQNQHSSEDGMAITSELPNIIATTSCDIRVQPCIRCACYSMP